MRRRRARSGRRHRSTGSCRTGSSTSPARSSGRWPRSPTTRPSGASTRIRAASARSARQRSSTARAAAASTRSHSFSCAGSSRSSCRVVARWPQLLLVLALLGATAAAFAVTERLKLERSPITGHPGRSCLLAGMRVRARRGGDLVRPAPARDRDARHAEQERALDSNASFGSGASPQVASRTPGTGVTTSTASSPKGSTGRACSSSATAGRSSCRTRSASTRRLRGSRSSASSRACSRRTPTATAIA